MSVAYPQLKVKQHTRSFFFYEPTVLIVLTGSIEFTISGATHRLANGDSVAFIDQGVISDSTKSPRISAHRFVHCFSLSVKVCQNIFISYLNSTIRQ